MASDLAATSSASAAARLPKLRDIVELLKPITWFAPMWAFLCGVVSAGAPLIQRWPEALAGVLLAGPLVCATSQAVNEWFDRHVDAINEPNRPIPSGRVPGRWGLWLALIGTTISAVFAALLGPVVFVAGLIGLALAWAYSAPPLRLKRSYIAGPGAVALSYEGLAWFTGAALMSGGLPAWPSILLALLYSIGAHGIMTLNDFKAIEGDRATGIRSMPAVLGTTRAAQIACLVMLIPQGAVLTLLVVLGKPAFAALIALLILGQALCARRLLRDPARFAPWYNATGVTQFVLGMMASAIAISPFFRPA